MRLSKSTSSISKIQSILSKSLELLIYDFTVKKGDVVNVYNYEERTVSELKLYKKPANNVDAAYI